MSEPLEAMEPGLKALLQRGADVAPPPGTAARVLSQLQTATAGAAAVASPAAVHAVSGWGARGLAAGLIIGAAGGLVAGRTVFERVEVRVVERVVPAPAAAPAPEPLREPALLPEPAAKPQVAPRVPDRRETRTAAPAPTDASLAQERTLVEKARSALVRGDAAQALESLDEHQRRFAEGRLTEERESLAIQALLRLKQTEAARERAEKFHRLWPDSLFGPVVDAAFQ